MDVLRPPRKRHGVRHHHHGRLQGHRAGDGLRPSSQGAPGLRHLGCDSAPLGRAEPGRFSKRDRPFPRRESRQGLSVRLRVSRGSRSLLLRRKLVRRSSKCERLLERVLFQEVAVRVVQTVTN